MKEKKLIVSETEIEMVNDLVRNMKSPSNLIGQFMDMRENPSSEQHFNPIVARLSVDDFAKVIYGRRDMDFVAMPISVFEFIMLPNRSVGLITSIEGGRVKGQSYTFNFDSVKEGEFDIPYNEAVRVDTELQNIIDLFTKIGRRPFELLEGDVILKRSFDRNEIHAYLIPAYHIGVIYREIKAIYPVGSAERI